LKREKKAAEKKRKIKDFIKINFGKNEFDVQKELP
jgi:hypothetical protein